MWQQPVLLRLPAFAPQQVGRVEHHVSKALARKRQVGEVRDHLWLAAEFPPVAERVHTRMRVNREHVATGEVEALTSAAGV